VGAYLGGGSHPVPRRYTGRAYRKTTDIAAEIIESFALPWRLKVRVLFDAFYR